MVLWCQCSVDQENYQMDEMNGVMSVRLLLGCSLFECTLYCTLYCMLSFLYAGLRRQQRQLTICTQCLHGRQVSNHITEVKTNYCHAMQDVPAIPFHINMKSCQYCHRPKCQWTIKSNQKSITSQTIQPIIQINNK